MHNDKYIKSEIKVYNNRISTNFEGIKIPKDNQYCTCLPVILWNSVVEIENDYKSASIFRRRQIWSEKEKNNEYD